MKVCYITNIGKVRYRNEDSLLVNGRVIAKTSMNTPECVEISFDVPLLFAVADGMGGHACGDEASRLVLEFLKGKYPEDAEGVSKIIKEAKDFLDKFIEEGHEFCYGMGTALAGIYLFPEGKTIVFNVGDCRVYRFREGKLELLTRDHTFVFKFYEEGRISYDELRVRPDRNLLESAIMGGYPETPEVFVWETHYKKGDRFLVCSDGLWEPISFNEKVACLKKEVLREASECLFGLAYQEGRDNISFILCEVP
ncbi:PP2C family protein-serine/threonine phosphatase [Aquifex sp.]